MHVFSRRRSLYRRRSAAYRLRVAIFAASRYSETSLFQLRLMQKMNRLLAVLVVVCAALATLYGLVHFGARSVPRAIAVNEAPLGCEDEPELTAECSGEDEAPADG